MEVVRKDIKNLHLAVYPPNGRIRVAAPMRLDDDVVRLAVVSRLGWIRRQRQRLVNQARQSGRDYVSRESHYYLGRRFLLNVINEEGFTRVAVAGNQTIQLCVKSGTDRLGRERSLQEWYRKELKLLIPPLIAKWEPFIGVRVNEWGVKKMRTRWGTCNSKAQRIWINLELVKKPIQCLEYIIVHEMVHLIERQHNANFIAHMDMMLPRWRLLKAELNQFPLQHEDWQY